MPHLLSCTCAPVPPLLGVGHVGVHNDVPAASRRDDVSEQHTHGAVDPVGLDGIGGLEGLNAKGFGLVWDDREEDP